MSMYKTNKGYKARVSLRNEIIKVMTNPAFDGCTQKEIASIVGVHPRTIRDYLTPELWDEIKTQRLAVVGNELDLIDKAVYRRAAEGDIQAAKLLYSRWEALQREKGLDNTQALTPQELDAEIEDLYKKLGNI